MIFRFEAELWRWSAQTGWMFVTLPVDASDEIRALAGRVPRGFGSVRVSVTVGGTSWATSVFPDKQSGAYVLPVKRPVRTREQIDEGDVAEFVIEPIGLTTR